MSLPRYVVLESKYNNKYLRCISEDVKLKGFLQFSDGGEALGSCAKLEVVRSKTGNGLVHLRCCCNNKYLTRWTEKHWWIVAGADAPEENQSKWSCTLFKPELDHADPTKVRFMHVQLGHYACLWRCEPPYATCLYAGSKTIDKDLCDVCTFYDWELLKSVDMTEIESWGGPAGQPWSFQIQGGGITKIIIRSATVVDSVSFVGKTADGTTKTSPTFGGKGGYQSEIVLDWPREYLTSISGTHGKYGGKHVIRTLEFGTNQGRRHGPFGKDYNGTAFSVNLKRSTIVGFHGRSGSLVDAIGIYTKPTTQ